jgi:hypothetical protein
VTPLNVQLVEKPLCSQLAIKYSIRIGVKVSRVKVTNYDKALRFFAPSFLVQLFFQHYYCALALIHGSNIIIAIHHRPDGFDNFSTSSTQLPRPVGRDALPAFPGASRLGAGWALVVFEKQLLPLATSENSAFLLTLDLHQPCPVLERHGVLICAWHCTGRTWC